MAIQQRALLWASALAALSACSAEQGGLTARVVIESTLGGSAGQRALRAAAVPLEVTRLELTALDVAGSTLAKTVLATDPAVGAGELRLELEGGTWSLDDVAAGTDRVLYGRAFLDTNLPVDLAGKLGFDGRITGLVVVADRVTDAGTLTLRQRPEVRIPRLDQVPPGTPGPVTLTSVAAGRALEVRWTRPDAPDTEGYLVTITATLSAPIPTPDEESFRVEPGNVLAPGVRVVDWFLSPNRTQTTITGLVDGRTYRVSVYAFDAGLNREALNYSGAASATETPRDREPPSSFADLRLAPMGNDAVVVSYVAPGEDSVGGGTPVRYEVRTSTVRARLADAASFAALPRLAPPPPTEPGLTGMFTRTFLALEQSAERGFFLGIRAVDEADNTGPISVVEYSLTATMAPELVQVSPEVGVAGQPLSIDGRLFGPAPGTLTLVVTTGTVTTMQALPTSPWTTTRVGTVLPMSARSGTLVLTRAGDGAVAAAELSVLARLAPQPEAVLPPFEVVSAPLPGRTAAHAVYEVVDGGLGVEHGIRRIFGETPSLTRRVPFLDGTAPLAVAGTYAGVYDRFAFVAAGNAAITAGLISTATVPAELRRTLANVPDADGVGLALLAPTSTQSDAIPALLAFSVAGRVRTATVANLNVDAFGPFTLVTSTVTLASGVQLLSNGSTVAPASFLAYRTGTGTTARLALQSQSGTRPGGFTEDAPGMGPRVGTRFVMLDVPATGLVIAYEHVRADGTIEPRLVAHSSFGLGPGLAPYPREVINRRLEDVGLVHRGGRLWIALATTTEEAGGSTQLHYAEVDPRTLVTDGYGTTRGVRLDIALARNPMRARLGGKPSAVETTPLLWNGESGGGQTYLRR